MIIKWYCRHELQNEMLGMAMNHGLSSVTLRHVQDLVGLFAVGRLFGISGPINRNQDFVFKFDSTPLPDDWDRHFNFRDACLQTARDLWDEAGQRRIAIFWSGGIDSTTALTALIRTNKHWREQIKIYTSRFAIEQEYPEFYNDYLTGLDVLLLQDRDFFSPQLFGSDLLVTDGGCGDQMWGCNILRDLDWNQKYQGLWPLILQKVTPWQQDWVIEYIERQIQKFPTPIKTLADLIWMLTFTHKWDYTRRRHMARVPDITLFDSMHSFFNSFHLQRWAISNQEPKIGLSWNSYKQPAKDFIYEWAGHEQYRVNKLQTPSLAYSMSDKSNLMPCFDIVTDEAYQIQDKKNNPEIIWKSFDWCYVNP
jgi:hypothetical protein